MNEKEIVSQYTDNNKSTYDLANMYNTYPNKIRRILVKHGVQLKTKSEAQKKRGKIKDWSSKRTRENKQFCDRAPQPRLL